MKWGGVDATGARRPWVAVATVLAAFASMATGIAAVAAPESSKTKVLVCRGADGSPIITDPSDPRCYKPPLTETERAAAEEDRRRREELYRACKAEQRALQSLLARYPDKEKHDAARAAALAEIETTMAASRRRMEHLLGERKRLLDEAEFYPNGNLPPKLRRDMDATNALIAAQAQAIETQKDDAAQKNAFYDDELAKLKKLWLPRQADAKPCVAPRS